MNQVLDTTDSQTIEIISVDDEYSDTFKDIVDTTNEYFINNKGAAADFNLIKDIAERANQAYEDSISTTIAIPLYLGLLGTMFGIVYALFSIKDTGAGITNEELFTLLGGVKIAMVGSFTGLLLTLLNSAFFFKKAKYVCDTKRNDYYTFIQVKLLPILSKDMASSLLSIESNLSEFNRVFSSNIGDFNISVDKVFKNVNMQKDFVEKLDRLGFNKIIKYNSEIFEKTSSFADKVQEFSNYLNSLNLFITTSSELIGEVKGISDRFQSMDGNLSTMLTEIKDKIELSSELVKYLKATYSNLDGISDQTKQLLTSQEKIIKDSSDSFLAFLESYQELNSDKLKEIVSDAEKNIKEALSDTTFLKIEDKINKIEGQIDQNVNNAEDFRTIIKDDLGKMLHNLSLTLSDLNVGVQKLNRPLYKKVLRLFKRNGRK